MAGAQEVDAEREDYVVSVVEFAGDTQQALNALQRLFALREDDARTILREAPVAVRRGVNRIRAEYFRRALELAGARVEVHDGQGALVQAQAPAEQRAAAPRPVAQPQPSPSLPRPVPLAAPPVFSDAPEHSSPLTAAAPVVRESARATPFGDTLVMGSLPPAQRAALLSAANDTLPQTGAKWGELQRPSAARAPAVPAASGASQSELEADLARSFEEPPWATPPSGQTPDPFAPRELDPDPAQSLNRRDWAAPTAAAANSPQGPRELDGGDEPSDLVLQHGAPSENRPAPHSPRELSGSGAPGSALELAVDLRRRESSPRYDPIPAGERWKAPGAQTVARAQRKQQVHSLESGMGDLRPSPRPPGMPAPAPRPSRSDRALPRISETTPQPVAKPQPRIASGVEPGLWQVVGLPLSGGGLARLFVISAGAVGLGLIAKLSERLPWLGAPILLVGLSLLLAVCVEYQRNVFWAVATGDSDLEATPPVQMSELMRKGLHPTGLAAITHVLLWVWLVNQLLAARPAISIVSSPALWVLGFGPGFYWPIALGCAAARNHIRGVWDIGQGLRALGRAPLPIAQVALASGCTFAISLLVCTAVLSAFGLGPAFTVFAASGLPLALSHGFMGAWLGRVLRSRPDLFE